MENPDPSSEAPDTLSREDDPATLTAGGDGGLAIRAGAEVSGYRVERILGEGGMGTVVLAEQREPVHRRVAIKLIRSALASDRQRAFFDVERQAMARLGHPNVATLYETGTGEDGRPYVVMEYVEGEMLTAYCDQRRLDLCERVRLFLKVCAGVHHAHQKGILHRDLKPSNILVTELDGQPVPKVIDFGVARILDRPHAHEGSRKPGDVSVGTPAYMSPEALGVPPGADVDVRSDVYSLGVVLAELLAGVHPCGRLSEPAVELARRMTSAPPTPPSFAFGRVDPERAERLARRRGLAPGSLARRLRGDLDAIVTTAMALDPDHRYGAVSDLAADLERHLEHRPLAASPGSGWSRFAKLVRRHRVPVAAAIVVMLSLIGGLVARGLEARRANREAAAARAARDEAEAVASFLVELFEVSDPDRARGAAVTARELLDRGAERIRGELADTPLVRARVLETIGSVYRQMALDESAEPLLEEALELRLAELGTDHPDVAASRNALAAVYWIQGRLAEAEAQVREALAAQERRLGPDAAEVGTTLNNLAILVRSQRRLAEAADLYRRSLAIKERTLGPDDLSVARTLSNLGLVEQSLGEHDVARASFERALEIKRAQLPSDHPSLAATLANLAGLALVSGDPDRAESLYREALAIKEQAYGADHPEVARDLDNLALVHLEQGRAEEALAVATRATAIAEATLGPEHRDLARYLAHLGRAEIAGGRRPEGLGHLQRAVEVAETACGDRCPELATALVDLGTALAEGGDVGAARAAMGRALEIREAVLDPDDPDLARTRERLAELEAAGG